MGRSHSMLHLKLMQDYLVNDLIGVAFNKWTSFDVVHSSIRDVKRINHYGCKWPMYLQGSDVFDTSDEQRQ
ncbi:hypothetical protein BBBOND_0403180 [Babesia bigemina]|uniref:Uncharacterized protein n=1 Tax=Babesia bigemina TaxID=5866 RepID=A0A061DET3_BABBI|nr:hypothetical protein BBBOND_0403180 [Babesia bigemina]CDR97830.1 hypothetical protein BBBOND_0403180 [Babesia bigemina]|eukprot:XP_012770016.1 hypothetical protein BBBOND_0403180 [Babesia bigemina]